MSILAELFANTRQQIAQNTTGLGCDREIRPKEKIHGITLRSGRNSKEERGDPKCLTQKITRSRKERKRRMVTRQYRRFQVDAVFVPPLIIITNVHSFVSSTVMLGRTVLDCTGRNFFFHAESVNHDGYIRCSRSTGLSRW